MAMSQIKQGEEDPREHVSARRVQQALLLDLFAKLSLVQAAPPSHIRISSLLPALISTNHPFVRVKQAKSLTSLKILILDDSSLFLRAYLTLFIFHALKNLQNC